jgi:hypothetical protein
MAASASATFSWANSRALVAQAVAGAARHLVAIWFQWPGGV